MAQADFSYEPAGDVSRLPLATTILCDRDSRREAWCDDAEAAGLSVTRQGAIADFAEGDMRPLGRVVLADCPVADARTLAALARIDERVAESGAALLVCVSQGSLESVFACLASSRPQILVDPSHGDRLLALGRVKMGGPDSRVRDLSDDDRINLLRLTEQVSEIAEKLERLGQPGLSGSGGAFRFESPADGYRGEGDAEASLVRKGRPTLPDPRLVRQIIRQRQARAKFFDGDLFADPAWDMLLDLTAARAEHTRVAVTSLCIASGVPATTALRWISQMVEAGLLERVQDDADRRRAFIALTDTAAEAMARYFAHIRAEAGELV